MPCPLVALPAWAQSARVPVMPHHEAAAPHNGAHMPVLHAPRIAMHPAGEDQEFTRTVVVESLQRVDRHLPHFLQGREDVAAQHLRAVGLAESLDFSVGGGLACCEGSNRGQSTLASALLAQPTASATRGVPHRPTQRSGNLSWPLQPYSSRSISSRRLLGLRLQAESSLPSLQEEPPPKGLHQHDLLGLRINKHHCTKARRSMIRLNFSGGSASEILRNFDRCDFSAGAMIFGIYQAGKYRPTSLRYLISHTDRMSPAARRFLYFQRSQAREFL